MKEWNTIRQECPKLYKKIFPFECASGWSDLIYDLSIKIEDILNEYEENHKLCNHEKDEMFAVQVKEKYGTLCFYMSCGTDRITNLIHEAEALSSQTCEHCGELGKMRGTTWFEVRCDDCFSGEK